MHEDEEKPFHEQTTIRDAKLAGPAWPPPPRPRPSQGPPKAVKILAVVLAALLVAGGLGFLIYATTNQYDQALKGQKRYFATATVRGRANSQATVSSQQSATAAPLQTADAQIYATATAQAQPTATAQAQGAQSTVTAQAMMAELTKDTSGTAALNDPLSDNSQDHQWDEGRIDNNNTGCNFVDGSYQVQEALQGFLRPCFAEATSYRNFVYQVSMTLDSNCEGGLILRGDPASGKYYLFLLATDGSYTFALYNGGSSYTLLASGTSTAILTGLEQMNTLAVIARQGVFELFVNQTYLASAIDGRLSAGKIGVAAYNASLPATVTFSGAEVWTL